MGNSETANIGTPCRYKITELNNFHKNARRGDVQAIKASIVTNGIYRPIIINKGTYTDRPLEVLAGNHTLQAMRQIAEENPEDKSWQTVDVWQVDVDDDRATRIVLADNRTADLGTYDDRALHELLEGLEDTSDWFDGTGYTDEDYEDLHALMEEISEPEASGDEDNQAPSGTTTPENENETLSSSPGVPPEGAEGVGEAVGHTKFKDGYADQPTRMSILHFPIDQFIWVQEAFEAIHKEHPEFDGANTKAVIWMLEKETGSTAPTSEE